MRHADVIVIGAGVLGTFHAYFAGLKGCSTLLIERNPYPNDASTRNFGMVAQSLVASSSEMAPVARATREIYQRIQQERDIAVRAIGSLYLASTELEATVLGEFAQRGDPCYHCSYLDASEAVARYPFVQPSYCVGALLFPDDLALEPRRLLRQLIPYVVDAARVQYVPDTTIVSVTSNGRECRATDARGEHYTAQRVIVCRGAEYRTLFPDDFRLSGMRICKLQMMQTVAQPGFQLPHNIMSGLSILRYPAFAACSSYPLLEQQPMEQAIRDYGIHLLLKQTIDGAIMIGDSHEYQSPGEAGALEERTNGAINHAILRYAQSMLRLPSWDIEQLWNGYYPVHPEGEVYTRTLDGAIHIVSIAGKGMTLGAGFAQQHIDQILHL
jgi:FAD dependent oxidoreductase TIGR03364